MKSADVLADFHCRRILAILGNGEMGQDEIAKETGFRRDDTGHALKRLVSGQHLRTRKDLGRVVYRIAKTAGPIVARASSFMIAGAGRVRKDCENEVRCELGFRGTGHCPDACAGFLSVRADAGDFATRRLAWSAI